MWWRNKRKLVFVGVAIVAAGFFIAAADVARQARARAYLSAPNPSLFVVDAHGAFITQAQAASEGRPGDFGFWPLERAPDRVARATLALEDRRFYRHPGVDAMAMVRAAWARVSGRGARSGASTLAMQIARLQHRAPRTWRAKILEGATALVLTQRFSREELLKHYLRLTPYGGGSHGVAHAARFYFSKPVEDLSWGQIALLSAVPQSPARMNLWTAEGMARARRRAGRALAELARRKVISADEWASAKKQLADMGPLVRPRRPDALNLALHYESLARKNALGPPRKFDFVVHATLDLDIQARVKKLTRAYLDQWREAGAQQAAVMVVERSGMKVRARLGSMEARSAPGAAYDFTKILRSPGSTLKPFIYAQAFDLHLLRSNDFILDQPEAAPGVSNADGLFLGAIAPRQALANSRNAPAAHLVKTIGLESVFARLKDLRLHDLDVAPEKFGLSMAIGGLPVTMEDLMRAYGSLAHDGFMSELMEAQSQVFRAPRKTMSAASARLILSYLSDPQARLPAFPRYGPSEYPFAVALKTGTSQGWRDAWIFAISEKYLIGVWVGRPDAGSMRAITGSNGPARLANAILTQLHGAHPGRIAINPFPAPEGWRQVALCASDMKPASETCAQSFLEWLAPEDFEPILAVNDVKTPQAYDDGGFAAREQRVFAAGAPFVWSGDGTKTPIAIVSPAPQTRIWRNPNQPAALNRLALKAHLAPGVEQIVWLVDGAPYAVADRDQTVYWPLAPGAHRIQARLPFTADGAKTTRIFVE